MYLVLPAVGEEGRGLKQHIQTEGGGLLRQALHLYVQPGLAAAAGRGRHGQGDHVVAVFKEDGGGQEVGLQLHHSAGSLGIPEEEAPALSGVVALVVVAALLAADGVHRVDVLLLILQAEQNPAALQLLKAGDGRQLAHHRRLHGDLPAQAVDGHAGVHHDALVVQAVHPQAAHHAVAEHHLVQEAPLLDAVLLFHLEVRRGQQLAHIIPVALKGKQLIILHHVHPISYAPPAEPAYFSTQSLAISVHCGYYSITPPTFF